MTSDPTYDVFLCHAAPDKLLVTHLARRLKSEGLKPFLDKWHLVPGEPWQEALEEALDQSQTYAVFLGSSRLNPWQNEEMRVALDAQVRDKSRRVIPVLLPGASMPEKEALPPFLRRLTWVEFQGGLDDAQAFHCLVCGIKGIQPEDGLADSEPLPPRPIMIGVPHRNPFFTGREDLLSRLHQQLQAEGISVAQAVIHGLGGIGKTQAAIEYAHRFGEHYRFVLWVVAESEETLQRDYLSIARELDLDLYQPQVGLETAVQAAVKAWLSRNVSWLLVFDNADDPALVRLVRNYVPATRMGGKTLLTSRARSFDPVVVQEPLRVDPLELNEAVKFLIERTRNPEAQVAAELATELGCLPLALEQAAAYIHHLRCSFADYLAEYRKFRLSMLERGKPSTDYTKTVATTWALNFEAVRQVSPASAELLAAAAFLVPSSIPIEIFTQGGSALGKSRGLWRLALALYYICRRRQVGVGNVLSKELVASSENALAFWNLLEPLERYSLVERVLPLNVDAFKLHRLTQEVVKDSLGEKGRQPWAIWVIMALNITYPEAEFSNWRFCEKLQPHVLEAADLVKRFAPLLLQWATGRLLAQAGAYALARGNFAAARKLCEQNLESYERVLGGRHRDTLMLRGNLAETLRALGDLTNARTLQEQTLRICERVLGADHPDTLQMKSNLASTLYALGELASARKLQEQTLETLEHTHGSEHPHAWTARSNLALILHALGDFIGARKLQEQTLEIRERVLGSEHPNTLEARNNLALTLHALGDLAEARRLYEQTREIVERVLGGENLITLQTITNLAGTLHAFGDLAGARKLHEQNLEIYKRVLGDEHPATLTARNNLAGTLHDLGDLAGARKLHEQNLEILERVLGDEHPDTLKSRNNLAEVLRALGAFASARKLQEQTLMIQERVLGGEHPETTNSMNNLASTLLAFGDLAGARKLHERALEIHERVLGGEHPDTTSSTWNLLMTVLRVNDPDAEAQLIEKLRWLLDRDEDSIPSADQRLIRQRLLNLLNHS